MKTVAIYTTRRRRAILALIWSCFCVHLMNVSPIFPLVFALVWSGTVKYIPSALAGHFWMVSFNSHRFSGIWWRSGDLAFVICSSPRQTAESCFNLFSSCLWVVFILFLCYIIIIIWCVTVTSCAILMWKGCSMIFLKGEICFIK